MHADWTATTEIVFEMNRQVFKSNNKSMAVMKRYLRGDSDDRLAETYNYFAARMPRLPYPSVEQYRPHST
jgi:hypothetical protein